MRYIRFAELRDISRLLELLVQVNLVHHNLRPDLFKGPATKYSEAELEALLSDESRPIFVCVDEGGRVLGYCFCVLEVQPDTPLLHGRRELYIDDLCVDEAARRQGVAAALYEHVREFARSIGCQSLTLNVWTGNAAQAFYEMMGMKPRKTTLEEPLQPPAEAQPHEAAASP